MKTAFILILMGLPGMLLLIYDILEFIILNKKNGYKKTRSSNDL
jgi:hypothetical protein